MSCFFLFYYACCCCCCEERDWTICCLWNRRKCGGGVITERVQIFIWENCISKYATRGYAPYLKKFLKRLITEVESNNGVVLDELHEKYAYYITSLKDDNMVKRNSRVCKCISFLFPNGCSEAPSCPSVVKLMVPLQCSLNILEGDTGCAIWPSSLLLSEFVLSFPEVFSNKSCFEVRRVFHQFISLLIQNILFKL